MHVVEPRQSLSLSATVAALFIGPVNNDRELGRRLLPTESRSLSSQRSNDFSSEVTFLVFLVGVGVGVFCFV